MSIAVLTKPETKTLLLCYSETDNFEENKEYEITRETDNGYYVTDKYGKEQFFRSMDDIRSMFFVE
jgi:hypothetical protein